MTRRFRRLVVTVAGTVALMGVLSGCSTAEEGERSVDRDGAKAEVEELYEETLAVVGPGWGWSDAESSWGGCARSSRSDNTDSWSRVNQRFGELNAPALTIAERVAKEWNRLGYSVKVETDDTLNPPRKVVSYPAYLTGTTPEGFGAVFTVGEDYADFRGYSRCVPSDPDLEVEDPS